MVVKELTSNDDERARLFEPIHGDFQGPPLELEMDQQHLQDFKAYLEQLARWWMTVHNSATQSGSSLGYSDGIGFAKLIHACLESPLLRAICAIVRMTDSIMLDPTELLEGMLIISRSKRNYYFLYLLRLLEHPAVTSQNSHVLDISEPPWDDEAR